MKVYFISKSLAIHIIRIALKLFYLFPISKNKLVFMSFGGEQISCNPLYIFRKIKNEYGSSLKYYWVYNSNRSNNIDTQTIKVGSFSFIYHMLTASCVITNDTLPSYLPFRKKQLVINTWHGGGLFKQTFGKATKEEQDYNNKTNALHNHDTNLYISSSKAWSENVLKRRFGYTGKILSCGMPRNDIFFCNPDNIIRKIKTFFNIPSDDAIILYAPTFRGSASNASMGILNIKPLDVKTIQDKLQIKYNKKFHFIFRGHHTMRINITDILNASNYPDMQELLLAADIFISDYSSSLWDYSLIYRPCFIYAPDFEEYAINPGFESDYKEWPFPIAKSNKELIDAIDSFDLKFYKESAIKYQKKYGSYETGNSSKIITNYISDFLKI